MKVSIILCTMDNYTCPVCVLCVIAVLCITSGFEKEHIIGKHRKLLAEDLSTFITSSAPVTTRNGRHSRLDTLT